VSERCAECGLVYDTITPVDAIVAIRSFARRYREALGIFQDDEDPEDLVRRRPDPSTWSALEYAAHVRGVLELFADRVRRALVEDSPTVASVPLEENPWEGHDPNDGIQPVLDGLAAAANRMAQTLENADGDDWKRTVVRDGDELTVLWMARNTVHEGAHHLRDVDRVLRAARARRP